MVTIKVNERTKAGKALLAAAKVMAQNHDGISIINDDDILLAKMKNNHNSDFLSESEHIEFLKELRNLAE
jgi:hypothetical protein